MLPPWTYSQIVQTTAAFATSPEVRDKYLAVVAQLGQFTGPLKPMVKPAVVEAATSSLQKQMTRGGRVPWGPILTAGMLATVAAKAFFVKDNWEATSALTEITLAQEHNDPDAVTAIFANITEQLAPLPPAQREKSYKSILYSLLGAATIGAIGAVGLGRHLLRNKSRRRSRSRTRARSKSKSKSQKTRNLTG